MGCNWEGMARNTHGIVTGKLQWSRKIVQRLNEAFQRARPNAVPRFENFVCEMVEAIPKQAVNSNDCAFYTMLYMDNYNAATGTVLWPYMVSVLLIQCGSFSFSLCFKCIICAGLYTRLSNVHTHV